MGSPWEEVFDHQVDLFTFWGTPSGQRLAEAYIQSVVDANPGDEAQVRSIFGPLDTRARWLLMGADPIWVSPDMMTLIEGAAKTFQPEPLQETDLITPQGFMYLSRPLWMTDIHGMRMSYRAIAWRTVNYDFGWEPEGPQDYPHPKPGLLVHLYHDPIRDPDEIDQKTGESGKSAIRVIGAQSGGLVITHITPWVFGESYPDAENETNRLAVAADQHGDYHYQEHEAVGLGALARHVQVIWRLMSQTITVRSQARPPRAARKRYARAGFPDKHVVVVTLRRAHEGSYQERGDGEPVEWSHRWVVSGHWRNQWFPSLSAHRQVWISPYIKGPEDAPLVIRPLRAFKFSR